MTKYTGEIVDVINDIKRLYADIQIKRNCSQCGQECVHDFNGAYISYGDLKSIYFYCEDCEHEWEISGKIVSAELTIEVDD